MLPGINNVAIENSICKPEQAQAGKPAGRARTIGLTTLDLLLLRIIIIIIQYSWYCAIIHELLYHRYK